MQPIVANWATSAAFGGCAQSRLRPAREDGLTFLDLNGVGDCQRVLELNAPVPDCAVHFGVLPQKLDGAKVASSLVDLGDFRASHRLCAVCTGFQTTNPALIGAYETKIATLDKSRPVLQEKASQTLPPKGRMEEFIEHALTFLASPYKIWENGSFTLRRTVVKLALAERPTYD